jgi:hypothetical protein
MNARTCAHTTKFQLINSQHRSRFALTAEERPEARIWSPNGKKIEPRPRVKTGISSSDGVVAWSPPSSAATATAATAADACTITAARGCQAQHRLSQQTETKATLKSIYQHRLGTKKQININAKTQQIRDARHERAGRRTCAAPPASLCWMLVVF